jgi:type 1 glutamine amidotransferase
MRRNWNIAAVGALAVALIFATVSRADDKPAAKPIRVLLVCGGCCHDYAHQKDILAKGLAERANVEVTIAFYEIKENKGKEKLNPVYEKADWAKDFDVVIHDECDASVNDLAAVANVLKPHKDGLPGLVLHCGMHSYRTKGWDNKSAPPTPWFEFTGLPTIRHGAQLPIAITFTDKQSPITRGMDDWTTIKEELYNNNIGKLLDTAQPLARGKQVSKAKDGTEKTEDYVVAWTNTYNGKAKVFATTIGHNNETVADPRYLDLVTRGLLWTTGHLTEDGKPAAGYEAKK